MFIVFVVVKIDVVDITVGEVVVEVVEVAVGVVTKISSSNSSRFVS